MSSRIIKPYLSKIDAHSYWASTNEKIQFKQYIKERYPELKVSMTEWCQKQDGRRSDMGPAFTIANVIMDDLVYLDATTWLYWLAVSCYHHEDGLLYVNVEDKNNLQVPLRYYAYGQFTKYIQKGAIRIKSDFKNVQKNHEIRQCSFLNPNGDIVTIYINNGKETEIVNVGIPEEYKKYELYSTNANVINAHVSMGGALDKRIKILEKSITTIIYKSSNM